MRIYACRFYSNFNCGSSFHIIDLYAFVHPSQPPIISFQEQITGFYVYNDDTVLPNFIIVIRGLSSGEIESVFGLFTKFNIRKTDFSQNSIWEKRILHKIHCQKNGLFTKFNNVHVNVFRRSPHLPPLFFLLNYLKKAGVPFFLLSAIFLSRNCLF